MEVVLNSRELPDLVDSENFTAIRSDSKANSMVTSTRNWDAVTAVGSICSTVMCELATCKHPGNKASRAEMVEAISLLKVRLRHHTEKWFYPYQ